MYPCFEQSVFTFVINWLITLLPKYINGCANGQYHWSKTTVWMSFEFAFEENLSLKFTNRFDRRRTNSKNQYIGLRFMIIITTSFSRNVYIRLTILLNEWKYGFSRKYVIQQMTRYWVHPIVYKEKTFG